MRRNVLIDTHILIWFRGAPERLRDAELRVIHGAANCFVSTVSLWEIALLTSRGRLDPDDRLMEPPFGMRLLKLEASHCKEVIHLPHIHRDPFDRMLIAQARAEQLTLISRDSAVQKYAQAGVLDVLAN